MSITGTNGKSTVTRLVTHILKVAGRRVGTTTSDGVLVDERMVEPGDWTGPGGAWQILERSDVDVGVLETARGGLVLRGMGYESNDASVITNVTSDHLDLQGIHTLPELAEVKSTVARATRPGGWAVLNGDDPLVAAVARRLPRERRDVLDRARPRGLAAVRRTVAAGGRGYVLRDGWLVEIDGSRTGGADRDGGRAERRAGRAPDHRGRPGPDHPRRAGPPQRRQRPRRGRRGARARHHPRPAARRPRRLPAVVRAIAGPAQPVPPRSADRHHRLRPQRGRGQRDPRRRRGHRRRRRRAGRRR